MDYIENWLDKALNRLSCDDRAKFFELSDARTSVFDEGDTKTFIQIVNL